MTRIDFYILQDVERTAAQRFACRLCCTAATRGAEVVVQVENESAASEMDEALWNYPEHRFLPHGIAGSEAANGAPVMVTWQDPQRYDGVLLNLTDSVPDHFGRFERVAEIVVGETRQQGRERYRFYRDRGFPLYSHDMDDWETA